MPSANDLWKPSMSIGDEFIDSHHKTLLALLFETKNAAKFGYDRDYLRSIVSALMSYSKYHFLAEERLMLECKYPDLERHKEEHQLFINKVNEAASRMGQDSATFSLELYEFLKNWFINHILKRDKLIKPYITADK